MNEEYSSLKAAERQRCLDRRAALSEKARKSKSGMIQRKILALPEFQRAQTVMLFLNFRDEVETTAIAEAVLAERKRLVLPRCAPGRLLLPLEVRDLERDIEAGMWGIREPKPTLNRVESLAIEFIVVPGLGFDLQGNRLGYGGGYYDRFLPKLSPLTPRAALAFACQVIEQAPVGEGDEKITMLITEDEVYRFAGCKN